MTKKEQSAAQKLGLVSRRYEFGIYPTAEQATALMDQAAMVRTLQNALVCIGMARYLRKKQDEHQYTPYLLRPDTLDDPTITAHPSAKEMSHWVTGLLQHDPRWRALSTFTARRIVQVVDRSWQAFFRNIKQNPELAGKPKRKNGQDDPWIPYIHLKRTGDIGSAGSGCKLTHLNGKNWQLDLKGIIGPVHTRGQMPTGNEDFFSSVVCGRFIDADIKLISGKWKLSICCYLARTRNSGRQNTKIEFGIIDGMARVNGASIIPTGVARAQAIQDASDRAQSDRDVRWPKRTPSDPDWRDANREVFQLKSYAARLRRNALHIWTTHIVRDASEITIQAPEIKKHTKTPRGNEKAWGAAVKIVSDLNRNTLSYAPAAAIQMLLYKAEEAGIRCEVIKDETPEISIGEKLVAAGKSIRRSKRALQKDYAI